MSIPRHAARKDAAVTVADEMTYVAHAMHAWNVAMEPFFLLFDAAEATDERRMRLARVGAEEGVDLLLTLTAPPAYVQLHQDLWQALISARTVVATAVIGHVDADALGEALENVQLVHVELARHFGDWPREGP